MSNALLTHSMRASTNWGWSNATESQSTIAFFIRAIPKRDKEGQQLTLESQHPPSRVKSQLKSIQSFKHLNTLFQHQMQLIDCSIRNMWMLLQSQWSFVRPFWGSKWHIDLWPSVATFMPFSTPSAMLWKGILSAVRCTSTPNRLYWPGEVVVCSSVL